MQRFCPAEQLETLHVPAPVASHSSGVSQVASVVHAEPVASHFSSFAPVQRTASGVHTLQRFKLASQAPKGQPTTVLHALPSAAHR